MALEIGIHGRPAIDLEAEDRPGACEKGRLAEICKVVRRFPPFLAELPFGELDQTIDELQVHPVRRSRAEAVGVQSLVSRQVTLLVLAAAAARTPLVATGSGPEGTGFGTPLEVVIRLDLLGVAQVVVVERVVGNGDAHLPVVVVEVRLANGRERCRAQCRRVPGEERTERLCTRGGDLQVAFD